MLTCQRHLFDLPTDEIYLNCARRGPQTKRSTEIGIEVIRRQCQPTGYSNADFFNIVQDIKQGFSDLVQANDPERIAIIPSVSYGLANVANNLNLKKGDQIIVAGKQFPSNVYAWSKQAEKAEAEMVFVDAPDTMNRGEAWNGAILAAINDRTRLVALGNVHWTDGTLFDLKAIRAKTSQYNALLVIDGTQSIGALPFSVAEIQPDALITGGYKWMFGPYSLGLAYYGSAFDDGMPIEHSWINRRNSDDFSNLVNYQPEYRPKAARYSVGEQSNFILGPMLLAAIEQLKNWGITNIQTYCQRITEKPVAQLRDMGLWIEKDDFRSKHLFGVRLSDDFDGDLFKKALEAAKISVSFRGTAVRIAPNVYNTEEELWQLVDCFKRARKRALAIQ
ncbi:MAG: aminotransferase class V-fold PLP-dependent enzyme [Bacteroidota bacterium]